MFFFLLWNLSLMYEFSLLHQVPLVTIGLHRCALVTNYSGEAGWLGEPPCCNTTHWSVVNQIHTQSFHSNTTHWSIKHTHKQSFHSNTTHRPIKYAITHSFHSNTTHRSNRCTHRVAFKTRLSTHVDHSSIYVESSYLVTTSNEK